MGPSQKFVGGSTIKFLYAFGDDLSFQDVIRHCRERHLLFHRGGRMVAASPPWVREEDIPSPRMTMSVVSGVPTIPRILRFSPRVDAIGSLRGLNIIVSA